MKKLLFGVFLLSGCASLQEAYDAPETLHLLAKAGEQALSGETWGALYTVGTIIALGAGKWIHSRAKNSGEGAILGGPASTPEMT